MKRMSLSTVAICPSIIARPTLEFGFGCWEGKTSTGSLAASSKVTSPMVVMNEW